MHPIPLRLWPARFFLVIACIRVATTHAQIAPTFPEAPEVSLESVVVSASRSPQELKTTPSSVSLISLPDLATEQVGTLREVLTASPGVVVVNTGAAGAISQIFLRGANAHETLFMVDGVRMNDRSATYNNFLGAADLANLGRIEILRGPQSTLYGSSAMGGVILLDSVRGEGAPSGSFGVTGGSFDSAGASLQASGARDALSYSAYAERFVTANDRPNNALHQWSYASRLAYALTKNVDIGLTFRGENDSYQEAGSRLFPFAGTADANNYLGTLFGEFRPSENFTSRLTLGLHRHVYDFASDFGVSDLRYTREILDWQNTWKVSPALEVVGGGNFERSHYLVDGVKTKDEVGAVFVSTTARPIKNVTLTAGARYDDFKSVGSAATWRTGLAWLPLERTKIRATYGTGFSAPGSDDRYGVAEFGQLPSPNLKPEKSRGWDAGIDQTLLAGRATISATYFENQFRNLFSYQYVDFVTYTGRTVNLSRATTKGVELAVEAHFGERIETRFAYTYLEASDALAHTRLTRRPRDVFDAELRWTARGPWILGIGAHGVVDRVEGTGPDEDYGTVRFFTSYALNYGVTVKLRVENALNEKYEEVLGYPALRRGIFGSAEWKF